MTKELAKLFASRFIQRKDVKAVQFATDAGQFKAGDWFPDNKVNAAKRPNSPHLPHGFNMDHLLAHLAGERTYGHYLLDDDSMCKVFAFDIDLKKKTDNWSGNYVDMPTDWRGDETDIEVDNLLDLAIVKDVSPLDLWHTRTKSALPARNWYKYQMRHCAHILASKITEIGIDCAVAYSGNKGVHVYGMTGSMPAEEVREAALLVLEIVDEFQPVRGKNFWEHKNDDPVHGFKNFTIETFPKQVSLEGKNLGNLLRLPLGKNFKNPQDPTFFMDMTGPMSEFKPHPDPVKLLKEGNPFI